MLMYSAGSRCQFLDHLSYGIHKCDVLLRPRIGEHSIYLSVLTTTGLHDLRMTARPLFNSKTENDGF